MLTEKIELTMSHVGLGNLTEYAVMVLFGNAHSHRLVEGLSINPSQIESNDGDELYPAYFMTSLRVPYTNLLHTYKLWDEVTIGVDVKRFGETLLESNYIIANHNQVFNDRDNWEDLGLPYMTGNNLIVNESMNGNTGKRQVANPNSSKIAELEKVRRAPAGLALSKKIRTEGFDDFEFGAQFQSLKPIIYQVKLHRDALGGHAMIFAKYAEIMDLVEFDFLTSQLHPRLSFASLQHLHVTERDIYYYGNCYAGEALSINLYGDIELLEDSDFDDSLDYIPAGYLLLNFEVYQERTGNLLAMSRVKKIFAIPMNEQDIISDLRRWSSSN